MQSRRPGAAIAGLSWPLVHFGPSPGAAQPLPVTDRVFQDPVKWDYLVGQGGLYLGGDHKGLGWLRVR